MFVDAFRPSNLKVSHSTFLNGRRSKKLRGREGSSCWPWGGCLYTSRRHNEAGSEGLALVLCCLTSLA